MTDPPRLRRSLRTADGLAMVVGIMVGSGIFRTPGLVAAQLGQPGLTFVAWLLGGLVALVGAFIFAELSTRHPDAGGKYVYAREAFGHRAGFVIGWVEFAIYCAAIAAIGVVCGEYLGRLTGLDTDPRALGAAVVAVFAALNLGGVALGRWAQNAATLAKVVALAAVVVVAMAAGTGAGWRTDVPHAPSGMGLVGALAVAAQSVIWTYYGYPDAAKIAEEIVDPRRTLPRVYLVGIGLVTALYLLLNAAFLHVLPLERIASSTLVAADVMDALFGPRAGTLMAALALLVIAGSLNGNLFVTPRVLFGLARDGLAPAVLARVNTGGTPWTAMLAAGVVATLLAATGTFERLLSLAILLVLLTDGFMVPVLVCLRRRQGPPPFPAPLYPFLPGAFLALYAALFAAAVRQQPVTAAVTVGTLAAAYATSGLVRARLMGQPAAPR